MTKWVRALGKSKRVLSIETPKRPKTKTQIRAAARIAEKAEKSKS